MPHTKRYILICFSPVLLVWLSVLAGDWFMRFWWFDWGSHIVIPQTTSTTSSDDDTEKVSGFHTVTAPSYSGGDLSRLIGIPEVAEVYEETRPEGVFYKDPKGFLNQPGPAYYPIVLVGDSFSVQGTTQTAMFHEQLSRQINIPVYNRGQLGQGPIHPLVNYRHDRQFQEHPPTLLIWMFTETDLDGELLSRNAWRLRGDAEPLSNKKPEASASRVQWNELTPSMLNYRLPNTSALAQFARKVWTKSRWLVFRKISPDVFRSDSPPPMLYYGFNVKQIRAGAEGRRAKDTIAEIQKLSEFYRARGSTFLPVFIPTKSMVYKDGLPKEAKPDSIAPSVSLTITEELHKSGIAAVNLLPHFIAAADQSELLYWRDDTHWNDRGIQLAATVVADAIQSSGILTNNPAHETNSP